MKVPTIHNGPSGTVPRQIAIAYEWRTILKSSCNWIFEINFAINSKNPRLFVYSIKDASLYSFKCGHGRGGKNESPHNGETREVSNREGSHCSSLGVMLTREEFTGDRVGRGILLKGLSPTNSRMMQREIVMHSRDDVHDSDDNSDTRIAGRSHGCLVVDDLYINKKRGGKLIDWLKNGSIGVAHHNGSYTI